MTTRDSLLFQRPTPRKLFQFARQSQPLSFALYAARCKSPSKIKLSSTLSRNFRKIQPEICNKKYRLYTVSRILRKDYHVSIF